MNVEVYTDGVKRLGYQAQGLNPTWSWGNTWYRYNTHFRHLPGNAYLYVYSYRNQWGYQNSWIQVYHYANRRVYYSRYYHSYWGYPYSYYYSYGTGTMWRAWNNIRTNISYTDDGITYGGWAALSSLYSYSYNYSWGGSSWYGYWGGYNRYYRRRGYSSGWTTE